MGDHVVILLLSVIVLLGALYVYKVEQNIVQIKDELLQHGIDIKKVKEELELTSKALIQEKVELESMRKGHAQVKVELESTEKEVTQAQVELKSTKKELKQVKVELESTKQEVKKVKVDLDTTRNELKQVKVELDTTRNELKQVKVGLDTAKEQINILRKNMIDKDNARNIEINQIRANVNTLREELNKINTEYKEHNGISFSARLGTSIKDIDPWNTVIFDKVISNDGNSYNATTGIFTASIAGTYYFTSTIFTNRGSIVEISLKVNEQVQMWMYTYAATIEGNTATNSIIVKLKKDIKVRIVKHGDWGARPFNIHWLWSTFTGFLL